MIKSMVTEIGEFAELEDEPVIILFNDTAPPGLREVCIIHEFEEPIEKDYLQKGSKIIFGDSEYTVENIGHVANETLYDLGHTSLYFEYDDVNEILPGSVYLSPNRKPHVEAGDVITFIK